MKYSMEDKIYIVYHVAVRDGNPEDFYFESILLAEDKYEELVESEREDVTVYQDVYYSKEKLETKDYPDERLMLFTSSDETVVDEPNDEEPEDENNGE